MTDFDDLFEQIEPLRNDQFHESHSRFGNSQSIQQARIADAGERYIEMLSDRDRALAFFSHERSLTRELSMTLFPGHWEAGTDAEEACGNAIDQGLSVRHSIVTLALIRNDLYGEKVSSTLAAYVLNANIQLLDRVKLYCHLVAGFGDDVDRLPIVSAVVSNQVDGLTIDPDVVAACVARDPTAARESVQGIPRSAVTAFQRAKALLAAGYPQETVSICSNLVRQYDKIAGPLQLRARAYISIRNYVSALRDLEQCTKLMPSNPITNKLITKVRQMLTE